jgi:acyl dehydratase
VSVLFGEVEVGAALPPVDIGVTHQRVCMNAAVTWDWFPGHHDPAYAREQGQETIYLSTQFFTGFADRCATEWAGDDAFVRRRCVRMHQAIYAGDMATATGSVVGKRVEEGLELVDLAIVVTSRDRPCVHVDLTVELP